MARLDELKEPISQKQIDTLREALKSLQGNILQGHGRDFSVHIFLHFTASRPTVKRWIARCAEDITSAQQHLDEIAQYRQDGIPGRLFMSFFLSATGYTSLGFAPPKDSPGIREQSFINGMKKARSILNDPPQEMWDEGYRQNIDAMVLLADDDELFLRRKAHRLIEEVKAHADICAVEWGRVMRNAQDYAVEHFGFVDGRSQPLFFQSDIERERQQRDGTKIWPPDDGPDLVLVPDPYGRQEYDSGSYLVFRKLEQNVRGFKAYEKKLAQVLELTGEDAKRAGALIMGRFEDGTPVVLQRTAGRSDPVPNNFTYEDDPDGLKCPFQAHMRKVNPRRAGIPRIVRRGITYDEREPEPKDTPGLAELPSQGVGLLFMCYQKSIWKQFEYLQSELASQSNSPKVGTGIDPVIGQPAEWETSRQKWPTQWGNPRKQPKPFTFDGFVTLKGGEYFFAPSIYFLKRLPALQGGDGL
jgi:Dyp-type peroxidase family